MMANTVSRYLYDLTVNSQYLGITVWTVYCPLLAGGEANVLFKVKWLTAATLMYCIEFHTYGSAYTHQVSFQPPGVLEDNDHKYASK